MTSKIVLRYPKYMRDNFGGRSRNFRAFHRTALKNAARALQVAHRECAWAPSFDRISAARRLIEAAIEACRVANWERKPEQKEESANSLVTAKLFARHVPDRDEHPNP